MILLGGWVEHILHNAEVVVHYEIINVYVPCIGIHAVHIRECKYMNPTIFDRGPTEYGQPEGPTEYGQPVQG